MKKLRWIFSITWNKNGIQQGQCEEESIAVGTHRKISNDLTSHLKKVGKEIRIRPKINKGKKRLSKNEQNEDFKIQRVVK